MKGLRNSGLCLAALLAVCVAGAAPHEGLATLKSGKADLQSAGVLAFGPDAILFVGDPQGAKVFALDTADRAAGSGKVNITSINEKVAAMLGTAPDQVLINDLAVNPISKKVYLSVSRGLGPDAIPVIMRMDSQGKIEELSLDSINHDSVELSNAPAAAAKDRRGDSLRMQSITDLSTWTGRCSSPGFPTRNSPRIFARSISRSAGLTRVRAWRSSTAITAAGKPIRRFALSFPTKFKPR